MKSYVALLGIIVSLYCATATAATTFRDLTVEIHGQGRPVVMVPGLNSAAATWHETCAALQPIECHIIQLPGFAGLAPVKTQAFLPEMSDRLLAYIEEAGLEEPVLMGHSLGGVLSLMIAIEQPALPAKLVIVDSLPFFPAAGQPMATEESMRPVAEGMRSGMLQQSEDERRLATRTQLQGMTRSEGRTQLLENWGMASDPATTANAMYGMMTTDLRPRLDAITAPTLVLGAWAAYQQYGATKTSTTALYQQQYSALDGVELKLSDAGFHFLMWDDPEWLTGAIRSFLAE